MHTVRSSLNLREPRGVGSSIRLTGTSMRNMLDSTDAEEPEENMVPRRRTSRDDSFIQVGGRSLRNLLDNARPNTGRTARQSLPSIDPRLHSTDNDLLTRSLLPGHSEGCLGSPRSPRKHSDFSYLDTKPQPLSRLVKLSLDDTEKLGKKNSVMDAARLTWGKVDPTPASNVRFFGANSFDSQLEMERWLRSSGITTAFWGNGETKSASKLYKEVKSARTIFAVNVDDDGNVVSLPVRIVRVVRLIVKQRIGNKDMYLLEDSQEVGSTGTVRFRRKLLSCIIKDGESCYNAARRNVQKELRNFGQDRGKGFKDWSADVIRGSLKTALEQVESKSYPTLSTCYILHTLNSNLHGNLPKDNFSTTEYTEKQTVHVKHYWVWCPYTEVEAIIKLESDAPDTNPAHSYQEENSKDPGNVALVEAFESRFNPTLSNKQLRDTLVSWAYEEEEINAILDMLDKGEAATSKDSFVKLIKPEILQRFVTVRPGKPFEDSADKPVHVKDLHIKVLERLFRGCSKLKVVPLHGGYSGSIVLQVHSFVPGKQLTPSVVKVDLRSRIQDEYSNYNTVAEALGESAPSVLDVDIEHRNGEEYQYGGLKFELVGAWLFLPDLIHAEATLLSSLKEIFIGEQKHEIHTALNCTRSDFNADGYTEALTHAPSGYFSNTLTVIKEVFGEILRVATFKRRRTTDNELTHRTKQMDLFHYYELEKLIRRNVLRVKDIKPKGKLVEVEKLDPQSGAIDLFKVFLKALNARTNKKESYMCGIVHGDLNGMNVLVDTQEIVWLIDFALTDHGHVLRDLAKVESCVLLEYSPLQSEEDLELAKQVVSTLVNVKALNQWLPDRLFQHPTRLDFVWKGVRSIRGYLGYYCSSDPEPMQMCFAMLHFSLKALHYRDIGELHKKLALFQAIACARQIMSCLEENGGRSVRLGLGGNALEERMLRSMNKKLTTEQLLHEKRIYFHKLKVKESYVVDAITRDKVNIMKNTTTLHVLDAATKEALLSKYKDMDDIEQRRALLKQKSKLISRKVLNKSLLEHAAVGKTDVHLTEHRFLVILGGAATGKSCLLRKMLIRTCQDKLGSLEQDAVPVLILLIDLSRLMHKRKLDSTHDLLDAYFKEVYGKDSGAYEFLCFARKKRLLYLLFDGLDEAGTNKSEIVRYIARIKPDVQRITVSSRETGFDERAFSAFSFAQVLPLTQTMQQEIVNTRVPDAATRARVLQLLEDPRYSELIKNPLMLTLLVSLSTAVNTNPDLPYTKAGLYDTAIGHLLHKSSMIKFGMRRAVVDKKIESITRTLASKPCYDFLAHLAWNLHSDRVRDVAPERVTKLMHEHLFNYGRPNPEDDVTVHGASNAAPDAKTLFNTVGTLQTAVGNARCPLFAVSNTVQVDGDDGGEDTAGKRCVIRFVHLSFQEFMTGKYVLSKLRLSRMVSKECFEQTTRYYLRCTAKEPTGILTDHWWRAPLLSMVGCIEDPELLIDLLRIIIDANDASCANLMMAKAMIDQVMEPQLQNAKRQLRDMLTAKLLGRRHAKEVARALYHPSHHLQRIAVSELLSLTRDRDEIFAEILAMGTEANTGWLRRLVLNCLTATIPELSRREDFKALLVGSLFDLNFDIRESTLKAILMASLENCRLVVDEVLSYLQRPGYQIDALKIVEMLQVKDEDVIECVVGLMKDRELKSLACNALKTLLSDDSVYELLCERLFTSNSVEVKRSIYHLFQTQAFLGESGSDRFDFSYILSSVQDPAVQLAAANTYLVLHIDQLSELDKGVDNTKTLNMFLDFVLIERVNTRMLESVLKILAQAEITQLAPNKLNLLAQRDVPNGMELAMSQYLVKLTNHGFVIGWQIIINMIHSSRALLREAACAALPNIINLDVADLSQVEDLCGCLHSSNRDAATMFLFNNRGQITFESDKLLATLLHNTTSEDCSARIRRLALIVYTDLARLREEKRVFLIANLKTKMLGKSKKDLQVTAMACINQIEQNEVFLTSLITVLGDSDEHVRATALSTIRKIAKTQRVSVDAISPFVSSSDGVLRLAGLELLELHARDKNAEPFLALESRLAGIIRRDPDLTLRANCLSLFIKCGVMPPKVAKSLHQWLHDGGEPTRRCIDLVFNTLSLEIGPFMRDLILLARDTCESFPSISEEVVLVLSGRVIPEDILFIAAEPGVCEAGALFAFRLISQVKIEASVVELDNSLVATLLKYTKSSKRELRKGSLTALTSLAKGKLKVSEEAFEVAEEWQEVDLLTILETFHLTPANLPIAVEWMVQAYYTVEASIETWSKVVMKLFRCRMELYPSAIEGSARAVHYGEDDGLWRALGVFEGQALKLFDVYVKNFNESRRILALLDAVHKLEIATPRVFQAVFKICNLPGIEERVQSAALNTVKRVARVAEFNVSHALCIEKWTGTARLCWMSMFIDVDDPLYELTGFGKSLMHTPHQVTAFVKDLELMLLGDDSSARLRVYCAAAFLRVAPNAVSSPVVWCRALQDKGPTVSDLIRQLLLLSDTARISAEVVENFIEQIERGTNHELSLSFMEFFQEYRIKDEEELNAVVHMLEEPGLAPYVFDPILNYFLMARLESRKPSSKFKVNPEVLAKLEGLGAKGVLEANCLMREIKLEFDPPEMFPYFREELFHPGFRLLTMDEMEQRARKFEQLKMAREEKLSMQHRRFSFSSVYQLHTKTAGLRQLLLPHQLSRVQWYQEIKFFVNYDIASLTKDATFVLMHVFPEINMRLRLKGICLKVVPIEPSRMESGLMKSEDQNKLIKSCEPYVLHMCDHRHLVKFTEDHSEALKARNSNAVLFYLRGRELSYTKSILPLASPDFFERYEQALNDLRMNPMIELNTYEPEDPESFLETMVQDIMTLISLNFQASHLFRPIKVKRQIKRSTFEAESRFHEHVLFQSSTITKEAKKFSELTPSLRKEQYYKLNDLVDQQIHADKDLRIQARSSGYQTKKSNTGKLPIWVTGDRANGMTSFLCTWADIHRNTRHKSVRLVLYHNCAASPAGRDPCLMLLRLGEELKAHFAKDLDTNEFISPRGETLEYAFVLKWWHRILERISEKAKKAIILIVEALELVIEPMWRRCGTTATSPLDPFFVPDFKGVPPGVSLVLASTKPDLLRLSVFANGHSKSVLAVNTVSLNKLKYDERLLLLKDKLKQAQLEYSPDLLHGFLQTHETCFEVSLGAWMLSQEAFASKSSLQYTMDRFSKGSADDVLISRIEASIGKELTAKVLTTAVLMEFATRKEILEVRPELSVKLWTQVATGLYHVLHSVPIRQDNHDPDNLYVLRNGGLRQIILERYSSMLTTCHCDIASYWIQRATSKSIGVDRSVHQHLALSNVVHHALASHRTGELLKNSLGDLRFLDCFLSGNMWGNSRVELAGLYNLAYAHTNEEWLQRCATCIESHFKGFKEDVLEELKPRIMFA